MSREGRGPPTGARRQSHSASTEPQGRLGRLRSLFRPSALLAVWEALVAASVLPSVFLVVFQAALDAGTVWQWVVIYLADGLFLLAMLARFLTGYVERGVLVTDRKSVVLHYLKRSFSADLASVFPLELFAFAATGSREETLALAALLRLNRCIRCYRVWTFITMKENQLGTNTNLLTMLKSSFLAGLSIHIMACCWFAVSCQNQVTFNSSSGGNTLCGQDSWAQYPSIDWENSSVYKRYIVSLYWAVTTITSVGYGDILPTLSAEKWVSVVSMLWGVVLFGYILGGLASTLTTSDAQRARYIHRLNVIRDHLEEAGVSSKVKKKVINFYEYIWQRNRGNPGVDLFHELPVAFQAELSLETYKKVIEKSTLFRNAPEEFMRMLSLVAEQQLFLPSQVIINKGDIGQHMYIITRGDAEVISGDGEVVAVMKEGSIFGEVNLVHDVPCGGTVRAKTHCDLLLLSKKNIIEIMQHFPEMSAKMKSEIQRRCDKAFSSTTSGGGSQNETVGYGEEEEVSARLTHPASSTSPMTCMQRVQQWWDTHPVLPGTKFSVAWDLTLASAIILVCLVYTYEAGFSLFHHNVAYASGVGGGALFGITYLLDLVLVLDIVVSMKTAVRTPTGILTKSRVILRHYVCSVYFLLDVAAVVPLEVLGLAWDSEERFGYIAILRLNRLIKIWKVISFFKQMEGSLYISVVYARFLKFTFYIVTVTHFSACIWFPLACYSEKRCSSSSWAAAHGIPAGSPTAVHDYIFSLYWASATLTSVGYGDVCAHNAREMVFALVVQLTGIMLYGYCLGVIAATLTNAASFRISFEEKMEVVHQFMSENKLGKGLLQRVDHYFTLLWQQFRGETVPGGQDLMHDMPATVRQDVSMEECSRLLSNVPFFQHVDVSFLRQLSSSTSTFLFAPGDIILYSRDMGREMYFVSKGYVEVLSEDLSQVVTVQGPGGFFGELGFLFGTPRTLTVRAATNCKLVMLENEALQNLLPQYPLLAKEFEKLYQDREHVEIAHKAAQEASQQAMSNPRRFSKPSILSALATAMVPSLSFAIRAPMANTIAACVGSKDIQSMVACPCSVGKPVHENFVKFNRREIQEAMRSDAETGGGWEGGSRTSRTTLRQRRSRAHGVGPSPSDVASRRTTQQEGEGRERNRRARGGMIENALSYLLLPYTMNPNTRISQVWELVGVVMSLVSVLAVSTQAAFLHDQGWLWAINYLTDLYFIADMIVKLHTAFFNEERVLITHPMECAKHYFKTNFMVDLLSCLPTDIIVLASWTRDIQDVMRVLSMSRLNRLLRIYKLPLAFKYLESQIGRDVGTITEVKLALYMTVVTHLMACGWFILACSSLTASAGDPHTCTPDSWAMQMSSLDGTTRHLSNYSISYQYLVSVYWATATSTTVGYGDISAHNDTERVYAVLVMVLGVLAYGYIVASVAASLANADSGRAQYQEKLEGIKSFMRDQGLDSALQKRVINYYEYNWQRNKGVSFGSLFQGMPISLQADISLSLYKGIIDQVPLFQNTEIGFTKLLALSIQPRLFLSKEYIVKKGDIGSEMFFINRGMVEVVSEDGSVVFATMTEGKFFGEISLVFSCPRTASIRAATNCDVFVLTKADLDRALSYYPEIAEQIREVAGNRANLVKKRSQIAAKAAAEGKSAADAAKAAAQGTKDETEKEDDSKKQAPAASGTDSSGQQQPPPTDQGKKEGEGAKEEEEEPQKKEEEEEKVVVEEMEIEEPDQPPRPSLLDRAISTFRERVWPRVRFLFTFKIARDGRAGAYLRVFGCIMTFLSCFTITYQASFQNNKYQLWIANYVFELYFLIEIFLKFHLTYKDSNGQTVTDLKSIVLHYIKDPMGFTFDLVAVFPYEILAAAVPDAAVRTSAVLYLRLPHVIRGVRIQSFMSEEEKKLNQKTLLLRLIKFTVLISVCTHFVACLWYILGCQAGTCRSGTWAGTASLVNTTVDDADHYLNSLYWSMATMTTTGYGDLSATNVQEMIYAIAVMVAGKLIFGFILGSIASTLANMDTQRVLFEEKLNGLKMYMTQQKLSSPVQGRVINFFDYLWLRNKGTDPHTLLADMPYCMQSEVSLATTESLIKQVPLFASVSDAFLRHLTLKIRPSMFLPGDFIVHKGDVGLGLFFLYHGKAEVLDEDLTVTQVLEEGGYFGAKSLVYNSPMQSSVVAVTHVDVFSVSQKDFESVLLDHPNSRESIAQLAEQIYGQTMVIAHD